MDSEAIIFDMEGVWLEGGSTPERFYRKAAEELLGEDTVERLSEEEYRTLVWFENEERYRRLCEREGLDPESFWINKEERVEEMEIRAIENSNRELVDGAKEVFEALSTDYKLGVASNNTNGTVEFAVESNRLDKFVDSYYGLENSLGGFKRRKPNPFYINQVLSELDLNSGFYVGDKVTDVRAAHRAGLDAVYIDGQLEEAEKSMSSIRELGKTL
jgi:phosphoglycolate phosphatase